MNEQLTIPRHVAIILDGNGRWAKAKGMPRSYGHIVGAKNLEKITVDAWDIGIQYLTVYLFSTENWSRSREEVGGLMKLFHQYTKTCLKLARENNTRVNVIGDPSAFEPSLQKSLDVLVSETAGNTGLNFQMALNYGSRDEITRAFKKLAQKVREGELEPDDITPGLISQNLDTGGIPDPDLLIRPGGETRLSNYLMWQLAYTELYFTDTPWPAFSKDDLWKAVEYYNSRDRRYGGVKEE